MATSTTPTTPAVEAIESSEIVGPLSATIDRVSRVGGRVLITRNGRPVAAILPITDVERLDRFDAEWEDDFAVFAEIGAAFADADPEEIEREVAKALAEVRAELRVERAAGVTR